MPEVTNDADPEFFNKLTEDTLNTNKDLKEYYDKIESIYNGYFICHSGQEAEVTGCKATGDDQGSETDKSSYNDQTQINFISKFSNALTHLYTYYDSSLLKREPRKQCVYFKYWFYDKILKNISSDKNLNVFYNDMQSGDEDDKDGNIDGDEQLFNENEKDELVVEYLDREDEEEEDIADGSLLKEADDSAESEDVEDVEDVHRRRDEDYSGNNILLTLDNSNNCNLYKLKLNQIIDIKLLYDYFENYDDKTKITNVEKKLINSRYCGSFNNLIELYNKKIECESYYSDKKFCRELEEFWNDYSHTKIPTLSCNIEKSTSGLSQESAGDNELQEARPTSPSPRHGTNSDNSLSADLSDTKSVNLKESPVSTEMVSTVLHNGDHMKERQTLREDKHITTSDHTNAKIAYTGDIRGSHSMDSEASTTCHHGSVGGSCESSLQQLSEMSTESKTKLNIGGQENTENHAETQVGLKEETGNTSTIVSSASTVLGVSALAFMLYKFTPLGSLINNRRGGINTWDINEEGYDENLLFSSALGNTNSNNNNYSIGYYSIGNT